MTSGRVACGLVSHQSSGGLKTIASCWMFALSFLSKTMRLCRHCDGFCVLRDRIPGIAEVRARLGVELREALLQRLNELERCSECCTIA